MRSEPISFSDVTVCASRSLNEPKWIVVKTMGEMNFPDRGIVLGGESDPSACADIGLVNFARREAMRLAKVRL